MAGNLQKLKKPLKIIGIALIIAGHILVFSNQDWFLQKQESDVFSKILQHATIDHRINACPFSFPSFNIQWHNEAFHAPATGFIVSAWNLSGLFCAALLIFIALQFIFLITGEHCFRFIQTVKELLAPPKRAFILV